MDDRARAPSADSCDQLQTLVLSACEQAIWIVDPERLRITWANRAALAMWAADSIAELSGRDLGLSDSARGRIEHYKADFALGKTVEDVWTFFVAGRPLTARCRFKALRLPDGSAAILVEAPPNSSEEFLFQDLRSSEVLRHTSVMISLLDESGRVIVQNPAAQQAFGPIGSEGNSFLARCCEPERAREVLQKLVAGESFGLDIAVCTQQGQRWHQLDGRRTSDPATGQVALVIDERDATERKLMQDALHASERQFRELCMQAPIGIFQTDADGICTFVNPRWCEISGMSAEAALGDGWIHAIHPDDFARVRRAGTEATHEQRTWRDKYRLLTPAQREVWVSVEVVPIISEKSQLMGRLGVMQDVTQVELGEQRFALLFERSADAHVLLDEHARIIDCNQGAVALLGARSRADMLGTFATTFAPALQPDGQGSTAKAAHWFEAASTRGTRHFEWQAQRMDGMEIAIDVSLTGAVIGGKPMFFAIARDASARKEVEQAIVRSREAALEASRGKSQFLASMSHEIRTPMNGVLGMLQLALSTELSEEQREYLAAAHSSAEGLLEIINDILDLSKIEAGRLDIDNVEVSVQELLKGSLQTAALRAHAKRVELVVRVDPHVPSRLRGDPVRIRQVLTNLVVNAVKFTESGHVLVDLTVRVEDGQARLCCTVEDTGIGIAPEHLQRVFEAFQQADGSTTRRYGGTGLGLTISRELVARMHGELWAESAPGTGSRFHFTLPLQAATSGSGEPLGDEGIRTYSLRTQSLRGQRVLVVDDHPLARRAMSSLLTTRGAEVVLASSADEALSIMRDDPQPVAAALIDHMLDTGRGLALAGPLRALPSFRNARMILLRSSQRVTRSELRAAGFDFALDKPVLPDDALLALKAPLFETPTTNRHSIPNKLDTLPRLPTLEVLMVEDHPVNAHFLGALLARLGHRVVHAWNGARALALLASRSFDLVIMDVQMPEMDGLETTRRIRQTEQGKAQRVPILALTANAMIGDEAACLEAGMDFYLSKPVSPLALHRVLERLLRARRRAGVQRKVTATPAFGTGATDAFSRDELLARAAGEPHFMLELVQMFLSTEHEMIRELSAAYASGDVSAVRSAAHRMKGALQLVCADPAATLAKELEQAAHAGQSARFADLMERLRVELPRLHHALAALSTAQ